ncbi:MAG: sulfatase-like hydrolase/transferase [Pirellulaceae bacterium]
MTRAADEKAKPSGKPNIIVILSDDQGWGDLSVHGNTNIATPNIDSLARDGAIFDRFFVCPVCSPTRAEFLTGRYHPRGGVYSTSTGGERLDLDEKTIGDTFKAAGYATAAFGKWHNGMQAPYHPNSRGFDEYYGFCSGHWGHYFSPVLEHNGKLVRGEGYITDDFTNHALDFIEKNKDKPFLCYLPYNTPHSPMHVPDRFYEKFDGAEIKLRHRDPEREDLAMTRAALAMCENIDWNVGRILKKLDELKLAENTIVIYFADNGPNSYRFNGDMKGRKGSTDEGGVRVPMLIRWPAGIEAGRKIPQIAAAIDLLPTLADIAGIDVVGDKPLDGVSIKPLLTGQAKDGPDRRIFSHWSGRVSVRTQQFRLDNDGKLYDLTVDPGQRRDVSKQHAKLTAELRSAVDAWRKEMLPRLRDDDRPFPVGYAPITHLPARDGVPHGNVQRSARAPNCSYFTNWTSSEDKMTWDVELPEDGRYEAVVQYTCAADNVGSTIELSLNSQKIAGKISEAHDPPLRGAEADRASRGSESFVKDFKSLSLGEIDLKRGRGLLTLRALDVPGKQVADIRYVILTRREDGR